MDGTASSYELHMALTVAAAGMDMDNHEIMHWSRGGKMGSTSRT
jgi:hypothetical protein